MIFLCILAFSYVNAEIQWKYNPDLINSDDYLPRNVSLIPLDIGNYIPFAYSSDVYNATELNDTDKIVGAIWAGGDSYTPPVSEIAYFASSSDWGDTNAIYGNYTNAICYLALSYVKLEEVDINGTVLQTISLDAGSMPWEASNITRIHNESITYATLTGGNTPEGTSLPWENMYHSSQTTYDRLSINLTPIISNITVGLNTGAILTSKSMEILVEIFNFPYTTNETSVRLHFVAVFAGGNNYTNTSQFSWGDRLYSGLGYNATHLDINHNALCGNLTCKAQVNYSEATYRDLYNYKLVNKVLLPMAEAGKNISLQSIIVTFPPNVDNITWDPTLGVGDGPVVRIPPSSSTMSKGLEVGIILIAVTVASAIATALTILWFRSRRSKDAAYVQEKSTLVKAECQHSYQALA